jgi:hypothetical protein
MTPNSPQEENFSGQIAAYVRGRVGKLGVSNPVYYGFVILFLTPFIFFCMMTVSQEKEVTSFDPGFL